MANLKGIRRRNYIYDKIHKTGVAFCVVTTMVGTIMLTYQAYNYMVNIRPIKRAMLLQQQEDLLKEGKSSELLTDEQMAS